MPEAASLTKVKLRLGISTTAQDALLADILSDAEQDILTYTGQASLPTALKSVQCEMAVMTYNKRGAEGQSSHSEGGVSVSFDTLSPMLKKLLDMYRVARVVNTLS